MVLDYPFVWPLWNVAENSQRQVCKQSLTLSESTTCDGLCLASDTPQAALRPTYTPPNILARDQLNPYLQAARRKEVEQWQSGRIDPSYGSATPSCSGGMSNQKSASRKLGVRSVNIATGLRLPRNPSSTQVPND